MPLVCPQCQQNFEKHHSCPMCNVVLLYHAPKLQPETAAAPVHVEDDSPQWQHTPWGKIIVGLILAQGLGHGLRQLLTAGFLVGGDGSDVWPTLLGIVLHHAIHAVSLLVGGALSGAGQARGILYGSLVGLANGLITLFAFGQLQEASTSILIFAEPLIHMAVGGLGGALGMLIWRPAPKIPHLEISPSTPLPTSSFGPSVEQLFIGPIHMGRVCGGALVVVVGVVLAKAILEFLLNASQGTFNITSHLQAQLVCMEISALFALLGAAFAGATSSNGLKQGLFVGLGACVVVLGVQMSNPKVVLESLMFTLGGIVILTLVGGWFGSQLFPPISTVRRRRFSIYDS